MISYYGYTISPNQIETGEGFLTCRNVPVARTGTQEYLGQEIGLSGADADRIIKVCRSPDEVFSPAALASFEGKPVTNDHPPSLIGPDDVRDYEMGHAENVRRGTGEWEDFVLADLHIHARELIDAIRAGKREISCGYECEYVDNGDGTYSQTKIRGNHIAVVERGRAGKLAAILDSDTAKSKEYQAVNRPERKKMKKNGLFLKIFGQAVKDKSPEEIEQMAMDAADALEGMEGTAADEGAPGTAGAAGGEGNEPPAQGKVQDGIDIDDLVNQAVAKVIAALKPEKEENPIDAAINKLSGEAADPAGAAAPSGEEAKVVPAEEMDDTKESCGLDQALAVGILKQLRPAVAAIKDESERKAVADALIACVTGGSSGDIGKIVQVTQKNAAKRAADNKPAMGIDEVQAAYDAMNPHKNGGKKA